jgi:uncharacterized membrane protein
LTTEKIISHSSQKIGRSAPAPAQSALVNDNPSELVQFIGRLHPLLVHLPIGFIVLLATVEALALLPRFKHAASASRVIVALSVPVVIFSAACGWVLSWSGGYDENTLWWHKWLGTALVPAIIFLALLQWRGWITIYRIWLAATVVLLSVAGHFGGSLTHGSDYLSLLWKFSGSKPDPATTIASGGNDGPAAPPVFVSVIQPILSEYCVDCHNAEKSKGGLRMDTAELLFAGGDSGPALERGNASASLLIQRLHLPEDDDDHMPPSGKKQPSSTQIAMLEWWINVGAPLDRSVEELKMPSAD